MKTDSLFHRIFRKAPSLLFELIEQPIVEGYTFQAVEVKQTAFRLDGVFLPPDAAPQQPVFFLEVQFQRDLFLYRRLFAELFIYLDQHPTVQDWQAVVIYPKRSLEPEDTHPYRFLLACPQVHRIYLDELTIRAARSASLGLLQLIVESEKTAPQRGRELLAQIQQEQSRISPELLIELIETTIVYKFPQMSRQEIAEMLGLVELQETRVYQEGREEGRVEGRVEGERSLVLKQLARKIGTLSPVVQTQIEALSVEQLEALGEALLDFASLNDLSDWLRSHS